jgi:hypothetical protein
MSEGPRIYKSGDFLHLIFGPETGGTRTHSITLPINEKGFSALLRILSEREKSPFVPKHIATPAAPIQHMVDEWLKKGGAIQHVTKRDAPDELTLDDLDL